MPWPRFIQTSNPFNQVNNASITHLLWGQQQARAVRAATAVGSSVRGRRRPRALHQARHTDPRGSQARTLQGRQLRCTEGAHGATARSGRGRQRVLPQLWRGHIWAQQAILRAQIAVREFVPGLGESVAKGLWVVEKLLGNDLEHGRFVE